MMLNKITQSLNKKTLSLCTVTTLSLLLAACNGSNSNTTEPSPPVAVAKDMLPSALAGTWEKRGYGQLVNFTNDEVSVYQHNQHNCLLVAQVNSTDLDEVFGLVTLAANEQVFETKPENIAYDAHPYAYSKLEELPDVCADPMSETSDPLANYEVVWHNFNERYALFDIENRELDWNAIDQEFRALIEQVPGDEDLFELLRQMLFRTGDGHTHLKIEELGIDASAGNPPNWYLRLRAFFEENYALEDLHQAFELQNDILDFNEFRQATFNSLLGELFELNEQNKANYIGDIACAANDNICFGISPENIGYLAINQMAFYAYEGSETAEDLEILTPLMDDIINGIADTEALIIDIRNNSGGQDVIALELAGRFTNTEQLAFNTKARDKDVFANEYDVNVLPTGEAQYTKPIYLLIDNGVMSGAEVFTMIMKAFPHVTLIGESTFGILSDAHSIVLPIGWEVTMSNEIRTDSEGNVFEGIGIPAEHIAQSLLPENVLAGKDTAIEKALSLINGNG